VVALLHVRLFIFVHDEAHGAIFRNPGLGRAMCRAISVYLLAPPSVWKESHDYHHVNNAKMVGAQIGSYPVVSTKVYAVLSPKDRRNYAIARHPITIALGYLTGLRCSA
jgi:omega-6 fatty acid desaturase (delta-12 desaturase)